jgi:hypothetical protein
LDDCPISGTMFYIVSDLLQSSAVLPLEP